VSDLGAELEPLSARVSRCGECDAHRGGTGNRRRGSTSATTDWYSLFERTEIDSDRVAERAELTDPEINAMGQLRIGVAFRATPATNAPAAEMSDWALDPVYGESRDRPPMVHVFFPTKERSPIPALVTGTFQSDTSRRNLTLDHDGERGYEGQGSAPTTSTPVRLDTRCHSSSERCC
jgi:hypothetical protein